MLSQELHSSYRRSRIVSSFSGQATLSSISEGNVKLLCSRNCSYDASAPGGWTKCAHAYVHPKSKEKKELGVSAVGKVISVDLKGLQLSENIRHGLHFIRKVLFCLFCFSVIRVVDHRLLVLPGFHSGKHATRNRSAAQWKTCGCGSKVSKFILDVMFTI